MTLRFVAALALCLTTQAGAGVAYGVPAQWCWDAEPGAVEYVLVAAEPHQPWQTLGTTTQTCITAVDPTGQLILFDVQWSRADGTSGPPDHGSCALGC